MGWRDTAALLEEAGEGGIDTATRHEFTSNFSGFPHISIPALSRDMRMLDQVQKLAQREGGELD